MNRTAHGWGGTSHGSPARTIAPASDREIGEIFNSPENRSYLARGLGRSYGDCALNTGGVLIDCRFLNHFLSFDPDTGILECEAGVSLLEINRLVTAAGWMLPVVPGTQFVTVGGAIANDIHGKNHVLQGSFGNHLIAMKLARSNGEVLEISAGTNTGLFAATIGGLGLTGLIVSATLQLRPVQSLVMNTHRIRFNDLAELYSLAREHRDGWEYHIAWLDPAAACRGGHYTTANHTERQGDLTWPSRRRTRLGMLAGLPSDLPGRLLMKAGNLWYRKGIKPGAREASAESFLFPLDRMPDWNATFGRRGFFQYQCVLPETDAPAALDDLLQTIEGSGQPVSLAVGKWFGPRSSPGLISFPTQGFSLALDFANRGSETCRLMDSLDDIVAACDGRLYPAKDARMPSTLFANGYSELEQFGAHIDPFFASDFWARMEHSE